MVSRKPKLPVVKHIIVVQDSDDVSHPTRLQKIWDYFQTHDVDIVYHDLLWKTATGEKEVKYEPFNKFKILREQYLPGYCAYTKEIWEKFPYDENVTVSDDLPWHLHHSLNDSRYGYLPETLCTIKVRDDGVNIGGAKDGRRLKDYKYFVKMVKDKYGILLNYKVGVRENGKLTEEKV